MASPSPFAGRLKQQMQGAWASPEGVQQRSAVITAVGGKKGAYANCLRELMASGSAGSEAYEQCAQKADLRGKLTSAWGE